MAKKFANSTLDLHDDPKDWITTLEGLKNDMNKVEIKSKTDMSDIGVIIRVLSSLPEKYVHGSSNALAAQCLWGLSIFSKIQSLPAKVLLLVCFFIGSMPIKKQ